MLTIHFIANKSKNQKIKDKINRAKNQKGKQIKQNPKNKTNRA